MNTDKPTLDQVITYLTHRLDGMTMPGAVRMTTAAMDYLVELQAENDKLRAEMEQVKKKNKYSAHDVALILSDVFGDSCACNFNGNDEWLPEKCELLDTCPDVVGVACWEQYLKWRGQKEE